MFVPPRQPSSNYTGPGIALSAVGPEISTTIDSYFFLSLSDRRDFMALLIEKVVKKLLKVNPVAKILRTPRYRPLTIPNKKKPKRHPKHKKMTLT